MLSVIKPNKELYRKWLADVRNYNENDPFVKENPEFKVPEPKHIRSIYTPYKAFYEAVNGDDSPFFVKDTRGADELSGFYIGALNVNHDLEAMFGISLKDTWTYGVCDNASQVYAYLEEQGKLSDDSKYVVLLHPVLKKHEPARDGWRWHKWGPYIGEYEHCCEYLYDEEGIEGVLVFEVYTVEEGGSDNG